MFKPTADSPVRSCHRQARRRLNMALDLMVRYLAIFVGLCLILSCSAEQRPCRLCGSFKSDSVRTLREVEESTILSEEQREKYRKYYFGHLTIETDPNRTRAYFEHENAEDKPWAPWEVISETDTSIHVRIKRTEAWGESVIRLDGDCYVVEKPDEGWGEWFCRVELDTKTAEV